MFEMLKTKINGKKEIKRRREEVFDYVTAPKHWPIWYPLTAKVGGNIEDSLDKTEQCRETIRTPFLWERICVQAIFDWNLVDKQRPDYFVIEVTKPSRSYLCYRFEERQEKDASGNLQTITTWYRELTYTPRNWFMGILNKLWFEKIVKDASDEAMKEVERILNGDP